jgi:hypothetical protein
LREEVLATRRDLPAICLIYGVIFALAALGLPLGAKLDMAQKSELHTISGIVQDSSRTDLPKAGRKLHILVQHSNRVYHLTQDDLSYEVPALRSLRPGDNVTALVRHDFLGRDLEWVWEVQRDGVTILSYDQTQRFLEQIKEQMQAIALWAGVLSIGTFVLGIFLRMRFGAWRDRTKQSRQPTTRSTQDTMT